MEYSLLIKILGIFLLSSFMPLTAVSFFRFRLPKKEEEYDRIIKTLDMENDIASQMIPAFKDEYSRIDYTIPVAFTTFLVILGSIVLLLGLELELAKSPNFLFSGVKFDKPGWQEYQNQSLMVIGMGFIGGYTWSVENIFRRLVTIDLLPRAYYNVGIRMIFASLVALALHHLLGALPGEEYTNEMLPVIAFLTGMFPERAMHYIKSKIRMFSDRGVQKADDLPLDMIEGISLLHKIRLGEVGIDNAQNLAEANLIEVIIKTPYQARQLIDWAGQSKLLMYFKSDISKLRKIGIRTHFDLKIIGDADGSLSEIAQNTGIPELQLQIVYNRIKSDPSIERLTKAENALSIL